MKQNNSRNNKSPEGIYIVKSVLHSLIDMAVLLICTALFVVALVNLDLEQPDNKAFITAAIVSALLLVITIVQRKSFTGVINATALVISGIVAFLSIGIILLTIYISSLPKEEWPYIMAIGLFNGIKTAIVSMPKEVWILYGVVLFLAALPGLLKHDK